MSAISRETPLQEHIAGQDEKSKCFASVYKLASMQAKNENEKYQKEIIDYALEWQDIVTKRVDAEIAHSKKLRSSLNHYEGKLPGLRKKVNETEMKGKKPPAAVLDKLKRNEEKLEESSQGYEEHAFELIVLLEEAIVCGWKDLYPLVKATMKWESDRAHRENEIFKNLKTGLSDKLSKKFKEVKDYKAVRQLVPKMDGDGIRAMPGGKPNNSEDIRVKGSDAPPEQASPRKFKMIGDGIRVYADEV
jgi:hypothetical protein